MRICSHKSLFPHMSPQLGSNISSTCLRSSSQQKTYKTFRSSSPFTRIACGTLHWPRRVVLVRSTSTTETKRISRFSLSSTLSASIFDTAWHARRAFNHVAAGIAHGCSRFTRSPRTFTSAVRLVRHKRSFIVVFSCRPPAKSSRIYRLLLGASLLSAIAVSIGTLPLLS